MIMVMRTTPVLRKARKVPIDWDFSEFLFSESVECCIEFYGFPMMLYEMDDFMVTGNC